MRLYHMTSVDVAVDHILPERRMRLGRFDRLNDPFELLGASLNGDDERLIYKKLRKHWEKTLGILCMGKHWESPLMWAHYAKGHTGVCLGFDVPDDLPKEIIYSPQRLQGLLDPTKPIRGLDEGVLNKVLTTKYAQWSYEEEWRLFSRLDEKDEKDGFYYVPFGPNLVLREIIVGARCAQPVKSFRQLVKPVEKSVKIIKARPAFETFTMVRQHRVSPITVHP